jgi:hypothetical protein
VTTNTLLVRRNKIHSKKPLDEWEFGILKDSTHQAREVSFTTLATESTISSFYAMMFPAIWTYNITIHPTTFNDCLSAHFLGVEICCESDKTVEISEIYHNVITCLLVLHCKDTALL